jgi:hypothetical protein
MEIADLAGSLGKAGPRSNLLQRSYRPQTCLRNLSGEREAIEHLRYTVKRSSDGGVQELKSRCGADVFPVLLRLPERLPPCHLVARQNSDGVLLCCGEDAVAEIKG